MAIGEAGIGEEVSKPRAIQSAIDERKGENVSSNTDTDFFRSYLRGTVGTARKATTTWGELKTSDEA